MTAGSGFSGFAKMIKGGLTGKGKLGIGAALTAAPLLFQKDDTEDEYAEFLSTNRKRSKHRYTRN